MPAPAITFTPQENGLLQNLINDAYQDYNIRSMEGPLIYGILKKLEPQVPVVFTNKENQRLQYMFEQDYEIAEPRMNPWFPVAGQPNPTELVSLIVSIRAKLVAAEDADSDGA